MRQNKFIKSCVMKIRYSGQAEANAFIELHKGTKLNRAYPCRNCLGWHITTKFETVKPK